MNKKIIFGVALIIGLVIVALLFFKQTPFHYSGVVEAIEVNVPARLNDTIQEIYVQEGSDITQNAPIATLTCQEANLQRHIAKVEFDRAGVLLKTSAGSQENYDLKKNKFDQAQLAASYCNITSPLTGKVLYKFYEPGEFISAGKPIVTVADLSQVDVWVYVPHDQLATLSLGQEITGTLPEVGTTFQGTILAINDKSEFTPKNVQTRSERTRLVYGVKTRFQNDAQLTLKPGMTLEINF